MPFASTPFSGREVPTVMNRRVRLTKPFGVLPTGLRGTVTNAHPRWAGFVVEVRWETLGPCYLFGFEFFTKTEFNEYLTEC